MAYMCEQVEDEELRCSFLVKSASDHHSGVAHLGAVMLQLVVPAGVSAERPYNSIFLRLVLTK